MKKKKKRVWRFDACKVNSLKLIITSLLRNNCMSTCKEQKSVIPYS